MQGHDISENKTASAEGVHQAAFRSIHISGTVNSNKLESADCISALLQCLQDFRLYERVTVVVMLMCRKNSWIHSFWML